MRVSEAFHNGGAARGKSVSIESDLSSPRPRPPHTFNRQTGKELSLADWHEREKERCTAANVTEVSQRLAMGHLIFLLEIEPIGARSFSSIVDAEVVQAVQNSGNILLQSHYMAAWARLQETAGPVPLLPTAGVKVTPTRWDLANLLLLQACRGTSPLVSITHPNEGAMANGLLHQELVHGGGRQWVTPWQLLASHRAVLDAPPPPLPPLLIPDSTQPPTTLLSKEEAAELRKWCTQHLWSKRKESADRKVVSLGLQKTAGQKRKHVRPLRYRSEGSDGGEGSDGQ